MADLRLLTIGVYGFTEDAFFAALEAAGVDVFCDVRRRRGLRGSRYAFANSRRLQDRLQAMGIRYLHLKDLSPAESVRELQRQADKAGGLRRGERTALCDDFVRAYAAQCLDALDAEAFVRRLGEGARAAALFCVEDNPAACHRSLLARRLAQELNLEIEHVTPCGS